MDQETKREIFRNSWFTVSEAGTVRPLNLYHKEQEESGCREENQKMEQTGSENRQPHPYSRQIFMYWHAL